MYRNYLKTALRYLARHKGYSLINVLGLSVGIACCILIMLFVKSEWSFDRFHDKSDRIYRAWLEEHYQGEVFRNTVTPIPLGPVIQNGVPEAETTVRVAGLGTSVRISDNSFNDPLSMVDSNFFQVFSFPILSGNLKNPFPSASSVVLSETAAKKYFGNSQAVGKDLELQLGENRVLFTVSAIAKDPPLESSIQFNMLVPFANAHYVWKEKTRTEGWSNVYVQTFVVLPEEASIAGVNNKIASVMDPLVAKNYKPGEYIVRLQPLTDMHYNSTLPAEIERPSDPKYAYILATIGFLVLLIACINFITLSVGKSSARALEVGVRKVLGADRSQLVKQYWGEALLLTLFSLLIGIGLALLLQKPFNQLANRELSLGFSWFTVLFCLILVVVIGLLAGIYPALVISNFKPIEALKGRLIAGKQMGFFRKALVVGQFVASIIMIIGTISIIRQLNYLREKDLGYNKEHIVVVETNKKRAEGNKLAQLFEHAVQKNLEVISTTTSLYSMAEEGWMNFGYVDDKKVFRNFRFNAIDAEFVNTMGLKVIAGRSFSKDNPADSNYILVNEALVREYGWSDPIGQKLPGNYEQRILGVVQDFHVESLHNPVKPVVLALKPDDVFTNSPDVTYQFSPNPRISVRFRGGNLQQHVKQLESAWKTVAGDQDFQYRFLDDALNAAYIQEQRLSRIVGYASILSIFIACMGLFGLATLVVVRRTKEIGIRKVLGAKVTGIVGLISRDFMLMIIIAAFIAFPLAWWGLSNWLQDFAYRIEIQWHVFLTAAMVAMIVALITISVQAVKAATANPVKSLRTE